MKFQRGNIFQFIYTLATIWLMYSQYQILKYQNQLTSTQNQLTEYIKESGYSNELLNILDRISDETKEKSYRLDSIKRFELWDAFIREVDILNINPDTLSIRLSPQLERRIALFSQSVYPNRSVNELGLLSENSYSGERKRLLKFLLGSYVDNSRLFYQCDFSNILLSKEKIRRLSLRGLNLSNSTIDNSLFYQCYAGVTKFDNSAITNTEFIECKLIPSDFYDARLNGVSFEDSYLPYPVHFKGAYFQDVNFEEALVPELQWLSIMSNQFGKELFNDKYYQESIPADTLKLSNGEERYFYRIKKR